MLLLNRHAQTLTLEEEQWNALLEAGRERGWQPTGWLTALSLDGSEAAGGPQVPAQDAGRLADALTDFPPQVLAQRLGIETEELARLLTFLEHGSLLVCSDLLALNRQM